MSPDRTVQANIDIQITFDDESPVVETLETLHSQVAQTLEAFKPEFK